MATSVIGSEEEITPGVVNTTPGATVFEPVLSPDI
jgi:hypothetical protein